MRPRRIYPIRRQPSHADEFDNSPGEIRVFDRRRRFGGRRPPARNDACLQFGEIARGGADVSLDIIGFAERIILQFVGPGVDHRVDCRALQIVIRNGARKRHQDRMGRRRRAWRSVTVDRCNGIAPPLQTNLSQQWLAHDVACAREFAVESDEAEERFADLARGKKGA